ncbi:hypothetical protein JCM8202_001922 [Rhodotorula sphaerocarpa]
MVHLDPPGAGTSSLKGVALAIAAGVLVATGLNVQRLAHLRRDRQQHAESAAPNAASTEPRPRISTARRLDNDSVPDEQTPLLRKNSDRARSRSQTRAQRDPQDNVDDCRTEEAGPRLIVALTDPPFFPEADAATSATSPRATDSAKPNGTAPSSRKSSSTRTRSRSASSTRGRRRPRLDKGFLKNKLWLLGFGLMNGGELCNFLAYAFAPPSVVAPLGMVTLVANVFLAPLIVREPFRRKDLIGVAIAVIGGATVVYASHSKDSKLTPEQFLVAISRPLFIAYSVTSLVAISILAYLSETRYGDRFVLIDLALCALAGSFTVLSTKAISSFLNLIFLDTLKHWVAYPVLLVLVVTAVLQVNYVNKSLQRFESRIVVPVQYMTFALSTIVGSALLYRDFEGVGLPSLLNFMFGCLVSGGGVYLLTRDGPTRERSSSSTSSAKSGADPEADLKAAAAARGRGRRPRTRKNTVVLTRHASGGGGPTDQGGGDLEAGRSRSGRGKAQTTSATILLDVPASAATTTDASSFAQQPPFASGAHSSTSTDSSSTLLPVAVTSRPRPGRGSRTGSGSVRAVSLTLGGGYLLAASPGALIRVEAAEEGAEDEPEEEEEDEEEPAVEGEERREGAGEDGDEEEGHPRRERNADA